MKLAVKEKYVDTKRL